MTDVTQGNDQAVRDQTGTIVDQTPKVTDTTGSNPEQKSDQTQEQAKPGEDQSKKDDQSKSGDDKSKSLLNEKPKEGEKKAEGAPEKYEDFKLPEGLVLEPKSLEEAQTVFKELGLSQEGAQRLVDFHVKSLQTALEEPMKAVTDNITAWRKEVDEDPKLGPRMEEIKTNYSRMLDSLGDPAITNAFRKAMDFTGAGNHPAVIRLMDKISQVLTEGKPLPGVKPAPVKEPGKADGPGPQALWPGLAPKAS